MREFKNALLLRVILFYVRLFLTMMYWRVVDINDCDPNPCGNGCECINLENGYTCECVPGYTGPNCNTSTYMSYYD